MSGTQRKTASILSSVEAQGSPPEHRAAGYRVDGEHARGGLGRVLRAYDLRLGRMVALKETLAEELRFAMPPEPEAYVGRDVIVSAWVKGGFGTDDFRIRCLLTYVNRQPAVANYVLRDGTWRPFALDVVTFADGEIDEIVTFPLEKTTARYGLPEVLA